MIDRKIPATYIGLCLALFGPAGLAFLSKTFLPDRPNLVESILAQLVLVLICAMVLVILIFWERQTLSSIGIRPLSLQSIARGGAFAAFLIWVYSPFLGWVMALARIPWFTEGIAKLAAYPAWYLTLIIIIGGTAEEFLHRGYVIERLAGLTGSYSIAGLASVVVNALAHVPMWGWWTSLTFVLSGAVTTAFYLWRRDLLANIVAHVITDFAGLVVPILIAGK
ncbi:MAG: CPBP family intramembrane glutamic endopeptidase [Syntrophobacteraceae bacterium]